LQQTDISSSCGLLSIEQFEQSNVDVCSCFSEKINHCLCMKNSRKLKETEFFNFFGPVEQILSSNCAEILDIGVGKELHFFCFAQ
jgi:hypothetical protein